MKNSFRTLIVAATVASITLAAASAQADPLKCHAAIGKSVTKYQATVAKIVAGCHKRRNGAKIGDLDCNEPDIADTGVKLPGARTKVLEAVLKACEPDAVPEASVLALYPRCPSPVATSDDADATQGIDTFTELSSCLIALSDSYLQRIGVEVMGLPTGPFPLSKGPASCHSAIGKNFSRIIKTAGGIYSKCQMTAESVDMDLDFDASCIGAAADTSSKLSSALTTMDAAIADACETGPGLNMENQAAWAALGACGQNIADMQTCAVDRVLDPTARGLAASALELPATCASVADVIVNAGYGDKLSNTRLDLGWKGTAHAVDVIDKTLGAVSLSGCNPDCENCTVTHNSKNDNCRCSNNAAIACDTINAADPSCGGNTCHCMFAPPMAISASSTPVCVVHRYTQEFDGNTGEAGEYDVGTQMRAIVHTGISQTKPCPTCVGSLCSGGLRNGQACSVDADNPRFGPVSYDCPPSPGANISGSGVLLDHEFSSGSRSLTAAIPSAGTFCDGTQPCHCSVCSLNFQIGCQVNADCAAVGAGTCGQALASNPAQNSCSFSCTNDGNGNGNCDGPTDSFCSGFTLGNGKGIITCGNDVDCDANDCTGDGIASPGECGTCSLYGLRQCFLPTISATGTPGIFNSEGVSVFCSGGTGSGGIDNTIGLPGPSRMKLDLDFTLYCADGTTPYQLPAGSNCIP